MKLGIRDNVSEAVAAYHLHAKSVKTYAHSAVRRCAVTESVKQIAEFAVSLFFGKTEQIKNSALQFGVGNSYGAARKLDSVEHKVVALNPNLGLVSIEVIEALVHRCGEGMVHCDKLLKLLVIFKERELGNPQEIVFSLGDNIELFGNLLP